MPVKTMTRAEFERWEKTTSLNFQATFEGDQVSVSYDTPSDAELCQSQLDFHRKNLEKARAEIQRAEQNIRVYMSLINNVKRVAYLKGIKLK